MSERTRKRDRLWRSLLVRSAPDRDRSDVDRATRARSDAELLDRWRAGEATAGMELGRRHLDALRRFFAAKCPDPDELARRTLLASARAEDREPSSFRAHLFWLARRELYRHLDQRRRARIDFSITSLAEILVPDGQDE